MSAILKVSIHALGCPKALVDAEQLLAVSADSGCEISLDPDDCDVLLINTCSFVDAARAESYEVIEEALQKKKSGIIKKVIVTGCLPQILLAELQTKYPEIDGYLGTGLNSSIYEIISGKKKSLINDLNSISSNGILPRFKITLPHISYLRVSEGCSHGCSFCKIPLIRGRFRSFGLDEILSEANALAESGVKELNIIAQDTSIVGFDAKPQYDLSTLTHKLSEIGGFEWVRVLYTNPMHFTDKTLEAFGASKVLPYFEIPIQHASNKILKAMNREKPGIDGIWEIIEKIRDNFDDPTIRSTAIVGFPGETDKDFEILHDFASEVEFDRFGVFKFSNEEGTKAFDLPDKVPDDVASERQEQLLLTQSEISYERNEYLVGSIQQVIIDQIYDDYAVGRTKSDAPEIDCIVKINGTDFQIGDIVDVKITNFDHFDLEGSICS
ncbi:MAG: 30S ribosomal protein S12 methylthiotransferase RimO [Caldisericia bacterium]